MVRSNFDVEAKSFFYGYTFIGSIWTCFPSSCNFKSKKHNLVEYRSSLICKKSLFLILIAVN